ncbi:MAG TPA: hypothetical protein VM030_00730 [Acidimicrobiales bacterium]|nr:hypothetical protein [Acidimicrobiales bacterium]
MTVRKGEPWGMPGPLPPDGVVVTGDAEAGAVVAEARAAGRPCPPIGLLGGDLWRTLGGIPGGDFGGEERLRAGRGAVFPVDLGILETDGEERPFVAHVVARSWAWGDVYLALNAQWLGPWNVGPRAHPGDGRLDTYRARLGPRDRLQVRSRLPLGSHLPHPAITERRASELEVDLGRPLAVTVDGVRVGAHRHLVVRAIPDALTVVV